MDYQLNWKSDTLVLTIQETDISNFNFGACLQLVNFSIVQQGQLSVLGYLIPSLNIK